MERTMKRGEFEYIKKRKKKVLTLLLVYMLAAAGIYVLGLVLNEMSRRNIFTVISILFVLPWAKQLVAMIVLFPHHSVSAERYQRVAGMVPEGVTLLTDAVISSPDKIMSLDFVVIAPGQVVGLVTAGTKDLGYIRNYLSQGVKNWGTGYHVKLVDSERLFMAELGALTEPGEQTPQQMEEYENVVSYLETLIV